MAGSVALSYFSGGVPKDCFIGIHKPVAQKVGWAYEFSVPVLLWMDEILRYLRNLEDDSSPANTNKPCGFDHGFKVVRNGFRNHPPYYRKKGLLARTSHKGLVGPRPPRLVQPAQTTLLQLGRAIRKGPPHAEADRSKQDPIGPTGLKVGEREKIGHQN